jgi:hypothetical protein
MKKTTFTITALLASIMVSQASIVISGTSLFSAELDGTSQGVYLSSNTGSFDESLFATLAADTSFAYGTVIGNYTVMGTGAISPAGPGNAILGGLGFNLGGNIATGNEIGILVFNTSVGSATGSDVYSIWTNDWLVSADGNNDSLTGGGPFSGASFGSGSVVPEPSTYAALAGLCALGAVMVRRRRV